MSKASTVERYMLKLINQARANAGLDPLHFNGKLNTAAEKHSAWMLKADMFSHDGAGGSTVTDRMKDAGYRLTGAWAAGENIAWRSEQGQNGLRDEAKALFQALMNSPGHRANILSADYDEIGIGLVRGSYKDETGHVWDAVMVTQDFGRTAASNAQLAGPDQFILHNSGQGAVHSALTVTDKTAMPLADLTDLIAALDKAATELRAMAGEDHFLIL